jgi:hypothetical protein
VLQIGEGTVQRSAAPISSAKLSVTGLFCENNIIVCKAHTTVQLNNPVKSSCPCRNQISLVTLILPHENSISHQIGCCCCCFFCFRVGSALLPQLEASQSRKLQTTDRNLTKPPDCRLPPPSYYTSSSSIRCVGRQFYGGHIGGAATAHVPPSA